MIVLWDKLLEGCSENNEMLVLHQVGNNGTCRLQEVSEDKSGSAVCDE